MTVIFRKACISYPLRLTLIAALVVGSACGDRTASRAPAYGGQIVIAEGADIDKPNPLVAESQLDNAVNTILYRPLLEPSWQNGEVRYLTAADRPTALARSYEFFGPDSASLRYRMRSDARWTDGQPITAHDAAWTLEMQGSEEVASPRQDYNREIREIVVEDDSTLVVHFTRRYPEMFFHTSGGVVPRHAYQESDPAQLRSHPALTNPAGALVTSGPFFLAQWVRGQQVVLERNPDFLPQAILDRIVFRIIPEETTRMIELQTGNVDMTIVPFHFLADVEANDELEVLVEEKRSYEYIGYNPKAHAFFDDPEIRRALGLAIDIPALIEALELGDYAVPAGGPYPPIFPLLYDPEEQAPLAYDTTEARRILTSKGWTPGRDGILMKDGEPFRFSILTNSENRRRVDIAQIVERQWRRIGVQADIQTLEFNTVVERSREKNFEARIGGWGVGLSADLFQLWGDPELPFNDVSYDNPEVQRLFALALEQPTQEAAAPYWKQAVALLVADQPYTWLYYYDRLYALNRRIGGMVVNTLGPYQHSWEWFVRQ